MVDHLSKFYKLTGKCYAIMLDSEPNILDLIISFEDIIMTKAK